MLSYDDRIHHIMRYVYDQTGNLVATLPPQNVEATTGALSNDKPSLYYYNSLNQLLWQKTPDAGVTRFWYDDLGRIVLSQNAKQAISPMKYSYTLFDGLGRVIEGGELIPSSALTAASNTRDLVTWINAQVVSGTRQDVSKTVYDVAQLPAGVTSGTKQIAKPRNLRSRISAASYTAGPVAGGTAVTTYYSYDERGNVEALIQRNPALSAVQREYINIRYRFDQLSGSVRQLDYQPGEYDRYSWVYDYDASNRLVRSSTSRDSVHRGRNGATWDLDAGYTYYRHGPLARTELGEWKVQGQDFTYTLQGWHKGVNASRLSRTEDMGLDGNTSTYSTGVSHGSVAKDAYAYLLHYFGDASRTDYAPINSSISLLGVAPTWGTTAYPLGGSGLIPLYNGNIAGMRTALRDLTGTALTVNLYRYTYDQVNRLKRMHAFTQTGANQTFVATNAYKNTFSYDPMGNILTQSRRDSLGNVMDSLTYSYTAGKNQLARITDAVSTTYTRDLENQTNGQNYVYDAVGNLITDLSEGIGTASVAGMDWDTRGKVTMVRKGGVTGYPRVEYGYNALGNRIRKTYKPTQYEHTWVHTHYVCDAQGNTLAVYEHKKPIATLGQNNPVANTNYAVTETLVAKEYSLYGSSRLGIHEAAVSVVTRTYQAWYNGVGATTQTITSSVATTAHTWPTVTSGTTVMKKYTLTRGQKKYELNNHLGNVMVVVTDRKVQDVNAVGTFLACVSSFSDYYPFGWEMPGRRSIASYRYGFNGQENEPELLGGEAAFSAEFWMYDSRSGRRWNIDPKLLERESGYAVNRNNPMLYIDPKGDDPITAAFEAATAFALEAGLDFMTNMIIKGEDPAMAFEHINWYSASWEAGKSLAISIFLPAGGKTAAKIATMTQSQVGKLTLSLGANFMTEFGKNIYSGKYNDKNGEFQYELMEQDWKNVMYTSILTTLFDAGLGGKADELFEKLKKTNANFAKQNEKYIENLRRAYSAADPKRAQEVIDRRVKKVNAATTELVNTAGKATVAKAAEESTKKALDEGQKQARGVQ